MRERTFHVPALVAAAACWGVGTVITKQVLDQVEPLTLLPIQLSASLAFLLVVILIRRTPVVWNTRTRMLSALGVLNPGLAYALGLLGLASITASMSVLIWASEPALILLLALVLLRERVPPVLLAAISMALVGVVLVVYRPGAAGTGTGVALTVAAVGACALYTIIARRLLLDDGALPVVFLQQLAALGFALVLFAGATALGVDGGDLATPSASVWVVAAASGIVYYGLAFWLFLIGLRGVTASVAGSFITLVPVFGLAAGYLVGERLAARQWVGALVVLGAIAVVAARERRSAAAVDAELTVDPNG